MGSGCYKKDLTTKFTSMGIVQQYINYPYKNFSAYLYEAYSVPYFDKEHYVLRGGGDYTKKL